MDSPPSLNCSGQSEKANADKGQLEVTSPVQSPHTSPSTMGQTKTMETFADFIFNGHFASDKDYDDDDASCDICGGKNTLDDVTHWVACDVCEKWFHCKCVKITPAKAYYVKHYKCPSCISKKADCILSGGFVSEEDDNFCDICRGKSCPEDETEWVACDFCQKWFHCKCVKITPTKAKHLKHFKCPMCTTNRELLRRQS